MNPPIEIAEGCARLRIEQETIHLKAIDPKDARGDPVELTKQEAIHLAEELTRLSRLLDS